MRTTDLFKFNRSSKRLNESLSRVFGKKLNLESFDTPKLEDARNKLRTQIHTARTESGFNETIENEALTQAQWMHDAIVAELMDRQEHIVDTRVQEGSDIDKQELMSILKRFDENMNERGGYGDPDYNKILAALNQGDIESAVDEVWNSYSDQDGGEVDMDDVIQDLEYEFKEIAGVSDDEGGDTDDAYALASAGHGSDEDYGDFDQSEAYDMDQLRKDAAAGIKASIDKQSDDRIAKLKKGNEDEPFMAQVGRKIIGGVKGAAKGFMGKEDVTMERDRDPEDWDEGNTEPPNNFAIYINGKKWKVFAGRGTYADDYREKNQYQQLKAMCDKKSAATGKKWSVHATGEPATESVSNEASHQEKTTMKHIENPTAGEKSAAKDIKPGTAGYRDRVAMLKSAEADGRLKKESINTGDNMRKLNEGEIQQASAIVTAKTMVDRVGRWIEELSGMENETLLQLGDSIRDEMGQEQAKAFIEAVAPAIQQALENLKTTRDTLSTGVRSLATGEQPEGMLGADPAAAPDMGAEVDAAAPDAMNAEPAGDEFAAAEPAAGGIEGAGREQRESIDRQSRLMKILAG
jgi:hypothetical protein